MKGIWVPMVAAACKDCHQVDAYRRAYPKWVSGRAGHILMSLTIRNREWSYSNARHKSHRPNPSEVELVNA